MNDSISRQAALDALDKVAEMFPYRIPGKAKTYRQYNEAWSDAIDAAENALEALPSAQPSISCCHENDMVSREAVLDELDAWEKDLKWICHHETAADLKLIKKSMEALPPAQPECEDAVSRFEVLRLIDYSSNDLNDSVDNWYFQGKVKELPPVTPKQPGWIPTSERLPDNDRAVLVTLKWAEDDYEVAVGEYWHNSTASHGWGSFEGHVIAWHELPTPYREGGQE